MTVRFRISVAIAILVALVAHPLAHPMVKECPCTHAIGVAALERVESFVLAVVGTASIPAVSPADAPEIATCSSRAPPAA